MSIYPLFAAIMQLFWFPTQNTFSNIFLEMSPRPGYHYIKNISLIIS